MVKVNDSIGKRWRLAINLILLSIGSYLTTELTTTIQERQTTILDLVLDSEWCIIPELSNAILIAQVGAETVEQLLEVLEEGGECMN